jgi:hypothetical protein
VRLQQPGGLASLELKQLLAASEASGKEAKDALLEERRKNAEMQKKFDQLKSSTSGQMAFMRRKLEENYQNKLDELETELDEARDESTALRLQTKMLVEHIEGGQGAAQPVPAGFLNTSVEHQSDVESRHVSKLKKELAKRDAELRRYESDMAALREHHVGPAMEGVEALRRELEASQGECERLKLFIDSFGDDAAPAGGGGGGGAEVAALQRQVATLQDQVQPRKGRRACGGVARVDWTFGLEVGGRPSATATEAPVRAQLQQARQQAPPAPAASPSGPERSVSPVVMTDDLVSILESVHAD